MVEKAKREGKMGILLFVVMLILFCAASATKDKARRINKEIAESIEREEYENYINNIGG